MNIDEFNKFVLSWPNGAQVLDAGCGNGKIAKYMASLRPDCKIYGIDTNGKERKNFLDSRIKFYLCPVQKTHFPRNFFDVVVCLHVIEHLKDPEKAVAEFHRILKKDGKLLIEAPNKLTASPLKIFGFNFYGDPTHVKPFSTKELESLIIQTPGFTVLKKANDASIHVYILKRFGLGLLRRLVSRMGLDKTVAWCLAVKTR